MCALGSTIASFTTRRQIHLEVERKFLRLRHYPFHRNSGTPAFDSLVSLGKTRFTDVYFDRGNFLSRSGVWLRQRDGHWQAKVCLACHPDRKDEDAVIQDQYINSRFQELIGHNEVWKRVAQLHSSNLDRRDGGALHHFCPKPLAAPISCEMQESNSLLKMFNLGEIARITTSRESWLANGTFKVVLDHTDFGHVIGEVELECETEESVAEEVSRAMNHKIERFMHTYSWAFWMSPVDSRPASTSNSRTDSSPSGPKIMGKLSAYFEMMARQETNQGERIE